MGWGKPFGHLKVEGRGQLDFGLEWIVGENEVLDIPCFESLGVRGNRVFTLWTFMHRIPLGGQQETRENKYKDFRCGVHLRIDLGGLNGSIT
jgi:hypothetical protein